MGPPRNYDRIIFFAVTLRGYRAVMQIYTILTVQSLFLDPSNWV
jgi:hypothetical protein